MASEITDYSAKLIRAVKAEMARRDVTATELLPHLKISRNSLYSRLKFERSFETDELAVIVDVLGIDMATLHASAELETRAEAVAA